MKMFNFNHIRICLICILFLQGCSTLTKEQKSVDIYKLCYHATSIGSKVVLDQKPEYKTQFLLVYAALNNLVENKQITGEVLHELVLQLPVNELKGDKASILIEGATFLYDITVGNKINIENNVYALSAATGIRDGLKITLGK